MHAEPLLLAQLQRHNASGKGPFAAGLARSLSAPLAIDADAAGLSWEWLPVGRWGWTGTIVVDQSQGVELRLRLRGDLQGVRVGVRGRDDRHYQPVDLPSEAVDAERWSPLVVGPEIELRVEVDDGARNRNDWAIHVDELVDIQAGGDVLVPTAENCLLDVACAESTSDLELARQAIARIRFFSAPFVYFCSGGLIAAADGSDAGYFLTAAHCIATDEIAAGTRFLWNFRYASCHGGDATAFETYGSELVMTSSSSDATLLRLRNLPPSPAYFGWSTGPVDGAVLHRVSHPHGGRQVYSETTGGNRAVCNGAPPATFLYQNERLGWIAGGSSGAPAYIDGGYVIGELTGTCGGEECGTGSAIIDGKFAESYKLMQPWLDPAAGPAPPTDLRIVKLGRSKVTLNWIDQAGDEARFELLRRIVGQPRAANVVIKSLKPNTAARTVKGLRRQTPYVLSVRSCKATGCSVPVEIVVPAR